MSVSDVARRGSVQTWAGDYGCHKISIRINQGAELWSVTTCFILRSNAVFAL